MKKLIPFLFFALLIGCSDEIVSPSDCSITSPPPNSSTLDGKWTDRFNRVLSSQGLYEPHIRGFLATDLRVSGSVVWYRAQGDLHQYTFCGEIKGNQIIGIQQTDNWTPSQGVTYSFPAIDHTFTRTQ